MSRYRTVQLYTLLASSFCLFVAAAYAGKPLSFLALAILAVTAHKFWPVFFGSWYIGLNKNVQKRLFSIIPNGNGKTFYDIGSGDGRVVAEAARRGFAAYGVELNPVRYFLARRASNAHFIRGNFFDHNYRDADVAFMWLPKETVHRLEPKLLKEMKRGSIIVTHEFKLRSIAPHATDERAKLYVYRVRQSAT